MSAACEDILYGVDRHAAPNYCQTGEQRDGANAFLEQRPPDFGRWR